MAMGISDSSISKKLKGTRDFRQKDIVKSVELLGIDEDKIYLYFFTNKVQDF